MKYGIIHNEQGYYALRYDTPSFCLRASSEYKAAIKAEKFLRELYAHTLVEDQGSRGRKYG